MSNSQPPTPPGNPPARHRAKKTRGKKKPINLKRFDGLARMPAGRALRRPKCARPLTTAEVDAHNQLGALNDAPTTRILRIGQNGRPDVLDSTNPAWPLYHTDNVFRLAVSGLVLLYDTNGFILDIKIANNFRQLPGPPQGEVKSLHQLLLDEINRPSVPGATYYKAVRYRIELKFAVHYFNNFWNRAYVQRILEYSRIEMLKRELLNKHKGIRTCRKGTADDCTKGPPDYRP